MSYHPDWPNFIIWLCRWQTLIGAAIAIPFAAGAIIAPTAIEITRTRRRYVAARATMPMHLSTVIAYARASGAAIAACRTLNGTDNEAIANFEQPPIPVGVIENLERLIEASKSRRVTTRMARMIGEIQVLDSRMSAIDGAQGNASYLDSMILDAALIHAQVDSLFDFARGEASTIAKRLTWRLVRTALSAMRIREGRYTPVMQMVSRFEERDRDPEYVAKTVHSRLIRRHINSAITYILSHLRPQNSPPEI